MQLAAGLQAAFHRKAQEVQNERSAVRIPDGAVLLSLKLSYVEPGQYLDGRPLIGLKVGGSIPR